ncbi:MAG: YHS domain-containing protein [Methanophagales archaeon]|nr:YHS domain-containing protein [Methanophagales archaeon]
MGIFKKKAVDPVCGMKVDKETTEHKMDYKGATYYFCAAGCKEAFEEEPEKYLKGKRTHSMGH